LLLTVSQLGICLLVDFTGGCTTRPAIETVHVYRPATLDRPLMQRNIEMDSPCRTVHGGAFIRHHQS
jgi:hypothetical protein